MPGLLDSLPPPSRSPLDSLPPPGKPSLLSDVLKYSPVGIVQSLADAIRDPKHAIAGILAAPDENAKLLDKAKDSYKAGNYTEAAAHFLNYLLPGGSGMEDAGEDFQKGDVARGLAKTAGIASTMVAGAKGPEIMQAAGKAADDVPAVVDALKAGARAAAPDVAVGAAKAGAGIIAAENLPPVVRQAVGIPTVYSGGKQIFKGIKKGASAYSEARATQTAAPESPGDLPAPDKLALPAGPLITPAAADASFVRGETQEWSGALGRWVPKGSAPKLLSAPPAADGAAIATASPAPRSGSALNTLQPPAAGAIITKADIAKRALAEEMLKSGSATPEMMIPPSVDEVGPVTEGFRKGLAKTMRDLPPGAPNAIADANYAANQEPAQAAAVYEAAGRATKSQALSQMLHDEGLTSRRVANWTPEQWNKATDDRGMTTTFSVDSQGEVIRMLRKLEKKVTK